MTPDEMLTLIKLEEKFRGSHDRHSSFSNGYYLPDNDIKNILQQYNISFEDYHLISCYKGIGFRDVNSDLRDSNDKESNEYVLYAEKHLNGVLSRIDAFNNAQAWRWHIQEKEYEFLKNNVGKVIQFPDFKSASVWKKPDCLYFKIYTASQSKGKLIYPIVEEEGKQFEKEILFMSKTSFEINGIEEDTVVLSEVLDETISPDIIGFADYWHKK